MILEPKKIKSARVSTFSPSICHEVMGLDTMLSFFECWAWSLTLFHSWWKWKRRVKKLVMWELDCEESWAPKNWCFWIVVLEKTLESPLDCKEIQPVHPKDQSWVFIGRTDAEAETPILWPRHVMSWLTGKDLDARRDWGQEEKGTTEDEMAGWHHRLDGQGVWVNSRS